MKHETSNPGMLHVELTQTEAAQLLSVLEDLCADRLVAFDRDLLETALDRLGDAATLAIWLRENVVLDLPANSAGEVASALDKWPGDMTSRVGSRESFISIREKLANCLSCPLERAT